MTYRLHQGDARQGMSGMTQRRAPEPAGFRLEHTGGG